MWSEICRCIDSGRRAIRKSFSREFTGALPAIALDGHMALSTAYMNDCEPLLCFAQQVNGYAKQGMCS